MRSARVYIGHLAPCANKRDVKQLFERCGPLREISIKNGFGFAEFYDSKDAKEAVYLFHGKLFFDKRLVVEIAHKSSFNRRPHCLYKLIVKNIPPGTNWQELKDMMRRAGEVTFADISRDHPSEGVVGFESREDMDRAIEELDNKKLNGQCITLCEDLESKDQHQSHSNSRSRSPPRRRNRSPSDLRVRSPPRRRRYSKTSPSNSKSQSSPRHRKGSVSDSGSRSPHHKRRTSDVKVEYERVPISPLNEKIGFKQMSRSPSESRIKNETKSRSPSESRVKYETNSRSPSLGPLAKNEV